MRLSFFFNSFFYLIFFDRILFDKSILQIQVYTSTETTKQNCRNISYKTNRLVKERYKDFEHNNRQSRIKEDVEMKWKLPKLNSLIRA